MRIGFVFVLAACGGAPEPVAPPPLPDVVLITLDTTRADRLGAWGYADAHTPNLDALAARGRRYAWAWSPLPLTIPSHASMFTGLYPPNLGIRDNGHGVLGEDRVTLAERLRDVGYVTAASTAAFVTTRQWGFAQGFDSYFDDVPSDPQDFWHAERPGSAVVDDALLWKDAQKSGPDAPPRFLWVHLYDPHFPWLPPVEDLETAGKRPYDAELLGVDRQVGRLVEAFADRPTLFVVAGDHGEGLGEHGELNHGLYTYASTQHVPLLLSGAAIPAEVIEQPVSLVDLTPTVLAALGLPVPDGLDGRPVPGSEPRPLYMESHQLTERFQVAPHVSVVDGPLVLVGTPRPELYDAVADPGMTRDLAAERPADVERLRAVLDGWAFPAPDPGAAIDPEVAVQLQQLGYVDSTFAGDRSALPDPKDYARLISESQAAGRAAILGKPEEAAERLTALVAEFPDLVELRARHVSALRSAGMREEAAAAAVAAYARFPDEPGVQTAYAHELAKQRRFREAAELFERVAEAMPYAPSARAMAVQVLLAEPDGYDDAVALGGRYLAAYPDDALLAGLVGVALIEHGEEARALPLLELGATADRPARSVTLHLGLRKRREGDVAGAVERVRKELELYPKSPPALKAAYHLYAETHAWGPLLGVVDDLLATDDTLEYRHARAQTLFNLEDFGACRTELEAALVRWPDSARLVLLDANLLAKEGKGDAGAARFAEATALREKELAARVPVP